MFSHLLLCYSFGRLPIGSLPKLLNSFPSFPILIPYRPLLTSLP
jgi:hypothetical protein